MLKTISHITLSILVFALSVGITISKHYSNGKLYSYSVIGDAESCMATETEACTMPDMAEKCEMHNNEQENNLQTSCSCEDKLEYLHFDADYTVSEKLKISNIYETQIALFAAILFVNYSNLSIKQIRTTDTRFSVLKIPDFPSFFQVFRC